MTRSGKTMAATGKAAVPEAFGAHLLTTEELEVVRDVAGALVIHALSSKPGEESMERLARTVEMPEGRAIEAKRAAFEALGRHALDPLSDGVRTAFEEICGKKGDVVLGVMFDLVVSAVETDIAFRAAMQETMPETVRKDETV